MRSREFPLIHPYVDVGIESKSILPFRSFRHMVHVHKLTKLTVAYETKRNETLSSYCEPALSLLLDSTSDIIVENDVSQSWINFNTCFLSVMEKCIPHSKLPTSYIGLADLG